MNHGAGNKILKVDYYSNSGLVWFVESSDGKKNYRVTEQGCTCPDARNGICKHQWATAGAQGKRQHLTSIILLDLNTGLRRTELLSLKVNDVDFLRNVIRATETKNGEEREVEMNSTARALLIDLVDLARAKGWQFIFTNPRTGTRYKDIKKAFKNALRDAGITDLRFHDLRHTFASEAGDDPQVSVAALAETMGHKDWKTTMKYTHASKAGKLRVVEAQERKEENAGHKAVTNEKRQAS